MNGCVFKRKLPSGRIVWGFSIDAGRDENGKRKQIFKSGFKLERDAERELRNKLREKDAGELVKPDPQTYADFVDEWFREYGPRRCSPKTLQRYKELSAYVTRLLLDVELQNLSAVMLERVFNRLKDSGGFNPKTKKARPLSALSVHHIAAVVKVILRKAVKLKLLKSSPMDGVELPAVPRREARVLDSEKVAWYLDAARSYGLYEIMMFAAGTGCRRGECLALTWPDIDMIHGAVRIGKSLEQTRAGLRVKSTKTERTRTISLPPSLTELLRFHRSAQEENRRLFGPDYRADLNLVFCTPQGNYLNPDSVSSKACLIARKAGFEKGISLHTLRHSHASQLLASGASLPTVSKRLGHTDTHTTASIYSHALPKDDLDAAELWDANFRPTPALPSKARIS
jgi:integrase